LVAVEDPKMTQYLPRIISFLFFALLAAIVGFWASRLLAPKVAVAPVNVTAENTATSDATWARQFFGSAKETAAASGPVADSQLQVIGLISGRSAVALIAADGKPAKPISVGQSIVPGVILKAVYGEKVIISRQGKEVELPLPLKQNIAILTSGASRPNGSSSTSLLSGATSSAPTSSPPPIVVAPSSVAPPPSNIAPVSAQPSGPVTPISSPAGQNPSNPTVVNPTQSNNPSVQDVQQPIGSSARGTPPS
jgi:hypothetical protein